MIIWRSSAYFQQLNTICFVSLGLFFDFSENVHSYFLDDPRSFRMFNYDPLKQLFSVKYLVIIIKIQTCHMVVSVQEV